MAGGRALWDAAVSDLEAFLARCRGAVGPQHVITDPEITAGQVVDWTRRWHGATPAVVRPGCTEEVAAVVAAARAGQVALVPQGGNTGLVAGAVPLEQEVVLDLRRLDELGPLDVAAAQVTVGAGVTLAALQANLDGTGLAFGVDLAARDTATMGGMVATNAGGVHVLSHGPMRAQVAGLTAVLGTGAVVAANPHGLAKDNTGYDLAGLLCGSEGTLGVVTEVRLRLVAAPRARAEALLGFASSAAMVGALPALRATAALQALEAIPAAGLALVARHLGTVPPLYPPPPWAVLVEVAGDDDATASLAAAVDRLGTAVTATAVGTGGLGGLWVWRDRLTEAIAAVGVAHKADVTVPLAELASFLDAVPTLVGRVAPSARTWCFGHLGDGNVHVNVVGPPADDPAPLDAVYEAVVAAGGSVSAEHGVGRAKRAWMARQRGPAAVDAMRAIKAALDPDGILNPGVLLP
ncbi:MAG: FAD-binding oxidoreductase [Acidimicrobiia bacterium]